MPKRLHYICVSFIVLIWNLTFTTAQENLALHKIAAQISTWNDTTGLWVAENAVNGDKSCDTVDGRHYSATGSDYNPWWKVDLGRLYKISTIVLQGQRDHREQLEHFEVYLTRDNPDPDNLDSSNLVYTASTYPNTGIFNINTSATEARYCMIRRRSFTAVVLCEVEIFGTEIDLIQRIKRNVHTTMSRASSYAPTTTSWNSENAIDGRYSGDPNNCYCCSGTDDSSDPWWQIDLGDRYLVERVKIYGRTDGNSQQYSDLWIFVGDSSLVMTNGSLVYHGNPTDGGYTYDLPLIPARLFRFLIVRKLQQGFMTICEIQLYESKCATNTFDNNCSQSCHCANNESCYHANGTIACDSCAPGWMGNTCSTPCAIGTYGENCANNCSDHCFNGQSQCNTVTGHCGQGCTDGYTGPKCDTVCPFGTYGAGCLKHCGHCRMNTYCHHVNGSCLTGCAPGYQPHDVLCETECTAGTYGQDCALICSTHCYVSAEQCNRVTGECKLGCNGGYSGFNCTTPCVSGRYGNNCNESCGYCLSVDQCNPENGNCSNGCLPGYDGDTCKTECVDGKFGNHCSNFCHCQNDVACDKKTGRCSNGCDIMWTGDTCSEYQGLDLSLLKNATTQIGTFEHSGADRAVDRANNYSIDTCQCCSVAENKEHIAKSWWQIDLGQKYLIDAVALFGRSDKSNRQQIQGAAVYAGIQSLSGNFSSGTLIYTVPSSIGDNYHFVHQRNSSIIAQFFIVRINQTILTLCEFQLREKVCTTGSFGENCSHECHCKNGTICDPVTGYCPNTECEPGWKGDACNATCDNQTFGYGCNYSCHCSSCEPADGTCHTQCFPGWKGSSCSEKCPHRHFGVNCTEACHCFHNSSCNHVNGVCDSESHRCDAGWQRDMCDTACNQSTFGDYCNTTCNCWNETACDHVNGMCDIHQCQDGWTGPSCSSVQAVKASESPSVAMVAGGAAAAIIAAAVVVVVGFIMYRRHHSKLTEQQSSSAFSNLEEALRKKKQRRRETNSVTEDSERMNSAYTDTNVDDHKYTEAKQGAEDGGGYYDFGEVVGILIHELWDYIQEKKKNECEKLFVEFKKLPSGLIHPCTSADELANRGKNRYREMYAYDRTRVILEEKNDKGTDYVNANYIDGFNKTRKFVACQGPTKAMIDDFWRVVWQLKSDKIVMLTNLVEQGATKCIQYWPKHEDFSYGNVNVKTVRLDTDLDYDIRHLDVWKEGESPRRIRQYHFKSWPDKDVPDSTWCLLKFWRAVQTDAESKTGPIVVHCSAGVGRTGTFIALDNLVHQARDEGCVRPFQIVQSLREQRVNMVQTKEQYVYLHEVLADALSFGTHFVWSTQFEPMFMSLLQKEDGDAKTRLEVQYDLIQKSLKNAVSNKEEAPEYSNMETILSESDAYRPKLKKRGSQFVQQLGATFIPNYDERNTFLVAKSPDKSTVEEFWSLVDDLNIKTVVMLTEKSSTSYKTSCDLGSQNDNGTKFHVNKVEENIKNGHTERTFTFKESHREEEDHLVTVKQFEYTAWKDGYVVPGDARSLVDFIEAILKWQPHISESQPVLIYDGDGCSRSGILCVALNEFQRIKTEGGHINIVQSVKTMKERKPQLICKFEQYKFCYELILAYLKHTEVYQNLK